MKKDEIITIRSEALLEIVRQAIAFVQENGLADSEDKWVSAERAKEILHISSNSYLCYLRSHGLIEYSQPAKKLIVYNRLSLLEYLENSKQSKF